MPPADPGDTDPAGRGGPARTCQLGWTGQRSHGADRGLGTWPRGERKEAAGPRQDRGSATPTSTQSTGKAEQGKRIWRLWIPEPGVESGVHCPVSPRRLSVTKDQTLWNMTNITDVGSTGSSRAVGEGRCEHAGAWGTLLRGQVGAPLSPQPLWALRTAVTSPQRGDFKQQQCSPL